MEYQITCIKQDKEGVITHAGITGKLFTVQQVVEWINAKAYDFFTEVNGKKAKVYAHRRTDTGHWYLISSPDGVTYNNLDYLKTCPF
ncbi:MAG: DUF3892 domain-containing protein [Candidatus Nanoarchaeia archaeon]